MELGRLFESALLECITADEFIADLVSDHFLANLPEESWGERCDKRVEF